MKKHRPINITGPQIRSYRKKRGLSRVGLCRGLRAHGIRMSWIRVFLIEHRMVEVLDKELYMTALVLDVPIDDLFPQYGYRRVREMRLR